MAQQWEAEAELRRLNDPHPLPVSWEPAAADLVEDWPLLPMTATGWPGKPPTRPELWAHRPDDLRGSGNDLGDILTRLVPTGRLVVLGEPEAGKTILLVRLVLDLLPAVRLATRSRCWCHWRPGNRTNRACTLAGEPTDHRLLGSPAGGTRGAGSGGPAESPPAPAGARRPGRDAGGGRGRAIAAVNAALRPREGLVLSAG